MPAPTFIASVVMLLAQLLPFFGIQIESEALATTVTTVVSIASGLYIVYRQVVTGRSTFFGLRP